MKLFKIISLMFVLGLFSFTMLDNDKPSLQLALLKYNGGGDWYANPTALINLAAFSNKFLNTNFDLEYATVDVGSAELFNHPFVHMTGHGNVIFSDSEAENLRNYLIAGGFLHIDDNYGMNEFVRLAMRKVFPESDFIELPFQHPVYHQRYDFDNGLPKIHKHDSKPAQGFGIIREGRVVCFYSFESDLGDGWEDQVVHKDPEDVRIKALRMGANLVSYAFQQ
ncbi:MAG: hypothetical protein ACI86M_002284 [Saprospiraceae bacterium]|jgi:hypothetical protein